MTVTVFGYLILLLGKHRFLRFYFSVFSLVLVSIEKIFQTLIKQCLTTFPNTSKFIKNVPLRVIFLTLFFVFGNVVKHSLSCLIYYLEKCNSSEGPFLMQVFEVPYTRQV